MIVNGFYITKNTDGATIVQTQNARVRLTCEKNAGSKRRAIEWAKRQRRGDVTDAAKVEQIEASYREAATLRMIAAGVA